MKPTPSDTRQRGAARLREILSDLTEIPAEEWEHFASRLHTLHVRKNECIVREGEPTDRMFLIVRGAFRLFSTNAGKQINLGFDFDGRFVTSYDSFLTREPSTISIQALEDSELIYFDRATGGQFVLVVPKAELVFVHRGDTDNGDGVLLRAVQEEVSL